MSFVHTAYGLGKIVGEEVVRGRKQYRVAGNGFDVWIDESDAQIRTAGAGDDVDESNSVDLPYNPEPQFPAETFSSEQTIQPNHELDADERLSPADSLDFDSVGDREYPGPAAHLFESRRFTAGGPVSRSKWNDVDQWEEGESHSPHDIYDDEDDLARRVYEYPEVFGEHEDGDPDYEDALAEYVLNEIPESDDGGYDPSLDEYGDGEDGEEIVRFSWNNQPNGKAQNFVNWLNKKGYGETWQAYDPQIMQEYAKSVGAGQNHLNQVQQGINFNNANTDYENQWKQSSLSDKYIEIVADADHYNDPVQRFRDDPIREIQRVGHALSDIHDDDRMEHYASVVDSDPMIRESAWSDVRKKAQRLRREGKVHINDVDDNRVYASVDGDRGSYDVMIVKGGSFGGFGGGEQITDWHCSCDWGRWAFKRQQLHIGRLCSHGYAAYLEMQSRQLKDVAAKGRKKRADVTSEYKSFADKNTGGHIDPSTQDVFLDSTVEPMEPEDVQKLYNYVEDNRTQPGERNYDQPDYLPDPERAYKQAAEGYADWKLKKTPSVWAGMGEFSPEFDAYIQSLGIDPEEAAANDEDWDDLVESFLKQADVLRTRPEKLTPRMQFVPSEHDEHFEDVESDNRKTTGPGQIMSSRTSGRHDFDGDVYYDEDFFPVHEDMVEIPGSYHWDARNWSKGHPGEDPFDRPGRHEAFRRFADEDGYTGREVDPEPYRDFSGGDELLEDLRDEFSTPVEDDLGDMRGRNDDIRGVIKELREKGYDADQFVASRHFAKDNNGDSGEELFLSTDTTGNHTQSPSWYESSEDYVKHNEEPRFQDVTNLPDGDILKYSDGDRPSQGPKKANRREAWLPGRNKKQKDRPLLPEDWEKHPEWEAADEDNHIGRLPSGEQVEKLVVHRNRAASVEDPIEAFYKSGAADAIRKGGSNSGSGSFSDDSIAANANQFLMRTAGRNYSFAEQRELEDESHPKGARNLDGLDLTGTHYIS